MSTAGSMEPWRRAAPAIALLLAFLAAACDDDLQVVDLPLPVASVQVQPPQQEIGVGQSVDVTATPRSSSGNALTARSVTWTSTNPAVASVSGSGTDVTVTGLTAGQATIRATSEGVSGEASITVRNPVATITALSPPAAVAGAQGFTLTVQGSGFVQGSVVQWNGADRPTTYVSQTTVTATIAAGDVALAGVAQVRVVNPAPGGGASAAQSFDVNNPVPAIATVSPASIDAGSPGATLTVNGTGFVQGSVVRWNGADRPTSYISATRLEATIPAGDLADPATAEVTVYNGPPGGGTSNAFAVTVASPWQTLQPGVPVTNLSAPEDDIRYFGVTVPTGTALLRVAISGGSGDADLYVRRGEFPTFDDWECSPFLPGNDEECLIASPQAGQWFVMLHAFESYAGVSLVANLAGTIPVPVIEELLPNSAVAGSQGGVMVVQGTGFVTTARVQWNGADRPTHYVSGNFLLAEVAAADVANPGENEVRVVNPPPGGGPSNTYAFSVLPQLPGGFVDEFHADPDQHWTPRSGEWSWDGEYLIATAPASSWAGTIRSSTGVVTNFEVAAKMRRTGCGSCANHLLLRAGESVQADGTPSNGYAFQYTNNGEVSVFRVVDNAAFALLDWTESAAVRTGGQTNVLRASAEGTTLRFYVNGELIWSGNDNSLASGRIGVSFFQPAEPLGDSLNIDWVYGGPPAAPAVAAAGGAHAAGPAPAGERPIPAAEPGRLSAGSAGQVAPAAYRARVPAAPAIGVDPVAPASRVPRCLPAAMPTVGRPGAPELAPPCSSVRRSSVRGP